MIKAPKKRLSLRSLIFSTIISLCLLIVIGRAIAAQSASQKVEPTPFVGVEEPSTLPLDAPPVYPAPAPATPTFDNSARTPIEFFMPAPLVLGIVLDTKTNSVIYIEQGSAAEQAGVLMGDKVVALNKIPIQDLTQPENINAVKETVAANSDVVILSLIRNNVALDLAAKPKPLIGVAPEWDVAKGLPPTVTPVILPFLYL